MRNLRAFLLAFVITFVILWTLVWALAAEGLPFTARDEFTPRSASVYVSSFWTSVTPRTTLCAHFDPGVCQGGEANSLPAMWDRTFSERSVQAYLIAGGGASGSDTTPIGATPEPSTLVLMGATLTGLGWWMRRRK